MNRFLAFAQWLRWRTEGDPPARVGEQAASVTLYPTSERAVQAAPKDSTTEKGTER